MELVHHTFVFFNSVHAFSRFVQTIFEVARLIKSSANDLQLFSALALAIAGAFVRKSLRGLAVNPRHTCAMSQDPEPSYISS